MHRAHSTAQAAPGQPSGPSPAWRRARMNRRGDGSACRPAPLPCPSGPLRGRGPPVARGAGTGRAVRARARRAVHARARRGRGVLGILGSASLVALAAGAAQAHLVHPANATTTASSPGVLTVGTYRGIPGRFAGVQAAVDAAHPGDWVLVGPGDYTQ